MPFNAELSNVEARALQLWIEITEVNPLARRYTLQDIPIRQVNRAMKAAQKLDPTGITTLLLLRTHLDWFLEETQVSLSNIVEDREHYFTKLRQIDEFFQLMQTPSVDTAIENFQDQLTAATKSYKWHNKRVKKVIGDIKALAFIRRDALLAMESLAEHQFLRGDGDGELKYNRHVYEFWNVNTLLDLTVRHAESGISLCLIRDHKALFSYFAFVVRNGGNLYVLTDMDGDKYPGQRYMTRRADRRFEKRAFKFRFPYQLLDIPLNPIREKQKEGLVLYQKGVVKLKGIRELDPDQILWITMVFDLMKGRYWNQKRQAKQLSYTGEMLVRPTTLLDTAKALVPVRKYRKITLPVLGVEDTTSELMKKDWECDPVGVHEWMEKRYTDKVKTTDLNRVCKHEMSPSDRKLTALDPRAFGTKAQLRKDARWTARYNLAVVVKRNAEAEFKRREKEVKLWYEKKVRANAGALLKAIGEGRFLVPHWVWDPELPAWNRDNQHRHEEAVNIMKVGIRERIEEKGRWGEIKGRMKNPVDIGGYWQQVMLVGSWNQHKGRYGCFIKKDVLASVNIEFSPGTAEAVARLAGVEFKGLPDVIQHWSKHESYSGNHLLDNVDPMEWVPENPWRELNFGVGVALCKRVYNKLRSTHENPSSNPD